MIYATPELSQEELDTIAQIAELRDKLKLATRQARRWKGFLLRGAFARAIQGSNSIEGHNVSYEDVIAAIGNEEPLDAEEEDWQATLGYRDAMTYALQLSSELEFKHSLDLIKSLHFMMLKYDLSKNPGRWRPGYIYIRNDASGETVYEAPSVDLVPSLMEQYVTSLNEKNGAPVVVRAAMAHLNMAMVHPFSDGNGRMSRIMQTLVLSRDGILEPEFCSIEEYLGETRQDYYRVLGTVGKGAWHPEHSAKPWIRFCLQAHYRQAQRLLRRTRAYERVWMECENIARKHSLPDRAIIPLFDATFGNKVRNALYRKDADISENLASRDLKLLVDLGLLVARGERRGRIYVAAQELQKLRIAVREVMRTPEPEYIGQLWLPGMEEIGGKK
jgi:Fic family protein